MAACFLLPPWQQPHTDSTPSPPIINRLKRHAEADRAYHEKLAAVRSAVDAWMQRSHDAAAVRGSLDLSTRAAPARGEPQQAAYDAPAGTSQPVHASAHGKELRLIVDQLVASRGNSADAAAAGSGVAGGEHVLVSEKSINVLRAAVEAFEAAAPLALDRGVKIAPSASTRQAGAAVARPVPTQRSDPRFLHLPWWQRHQARLKHHWRVFRQQVDEDPEYADAVAHRWNKWLAITQFLLYNLTVVLIFTIASATARAIRVI